MTKAEKVTNFVALWVSRAALAVLAFAGFMYFLGGVDPVIAYPIAVVGTGLLLKEVL